MERAIAVEGLLGVIEHFVQSDAVPDVDEDETRASLLEALGTVGVTPEEIASVPTWTYKPRRHGDAPG